jgi:hypothetical protein
MKKLFLAKIIFMAFFAIHAQTKPSGSVYKILTPQDYITLRDSCTQLDIVFTSGNGGSMSMEGRSVGLFSSFLQTKSITEKSNAAKDGFIMWQKNGREFLTGDIFLQSDSNSYVQFKKEGKEYFHLLTPQGAGFLKSQKAK